jgi:ParB family chromosome partitioning protein
MMKRKALGKGLSSLIPEIPPAAISEGLKYLDPGSMVPNRFQPRETFNEEDMRSLTESIRRDGLLQPVVARPSEGGYEIVAGERRWRAAQQAGLKRIPVMIQNVDDARALELALVENLQRRDLDPVEEARAYKLLQERFDLTQEQIAERVGRSRPAVANSIRILKLPSDIQDLLKGGKLTRGHARALLALQTEPEIRRLADRLLMEEMTVRTTEAAARSTSRKTERSPETLDPNVRAAEARLQSRLGTMVKIVTKAGGKGHVEISFDSQEELSRLFDGLMTARF